MHYRAEAAQAVQLLRRLSALTTRRTGWVEEADLSLLDYLQNGFMVSSSVQAPDQVGSFQVDNSYLDYNMDLYKFHI